MTFGALPGLPQLPPVDMVVRSDLERDPIEQAQARVDFWEGELEFHNQVVEQSLTEGPNEYGNYSYRERSDRVACWGCKSLAEWKLWRAERAMLLNSYVVDARRLLSTLLTLTEDV